MNIVGYTSGDLMGLLVLAAVVVVILFILRFVLKMAFNVIRLGCLGGILAIAAVALLLWVI